MKQKVNVEIFGQTYSITGEAPPEYILELADFVDNRMKEISEHSPVITSLKIAVLSALNIADELFRLRQEKEALEESFRERLDRLIALVDSHLLPHLEKQEEEKKSTSPPLRLE